MKRLLAVLAFGVACAVAAPAPAAAADCVRAGEKVLVSSPEVLVVRGRLHKTVVGCAGGVRRTVWSSGPFVPNGNRAARGFEIAGRHVAYVGVEFSSVFQPTRYESVHVVDLVTGGSREIAKAHDPHAYGLAPRIRALALNSCGATASIAAPSAFSAGGRNHDGDRQLRLLLDGEPILLDAGLIELGSLRVTPSRVLWRRDGVAREHLLPARCPRAA